MKTHWLFPHPYRAIGWIILLLLGSLLAICSAFDIEIELPLEVDISQTWLQKLYETSSLNFSDELFLLSFISSLLFIAFSREKVEDEMISQLRLTSLQWSLYIYYAALALAIIFVHGLQFYDIMLYSMFTVLIVFIIRFRLLLRKYGREADREVLA